MTQDPLQVDLQDDDLLVEVELTTTLMAAANLTDAAMTLSEIDALLGVRPSVPQARGPVSAAPAPAAPVAPVAPSASVAPVAPVAPVLAAESA